MSLSQLLRKPQCVPLLTSARHSDALRRAVVGCDVWGRSVCTGGGRAAATCSVGVVVCCGDDAACSTAGAGVGVAVTCATACVGGVGAVACATAGVSGAGGAG